MLFLFYTVAMQRSANEHLTSFKENKNVRYFAFQISPEGQAMYKQYYFPVWNLKPHENDTACVWVSEWKVNMITY